MKTSSAKAKGRRLQTWFVEAVREILLLPYPDLRPALMGEGGSDVKCSSVGRARFPYAVECKNQETLSIWAALKQASANAGGLEPLLVFRRNRSPTYVVMRAEHFLDLLKMRDQLHIMDLADCADQEGAQ